MAEMIQVGLLARCQGTFPYVTLLEQGVLVLSVCFLLGWGGVLLFALRQSPHPWALLQTWCRHWAAPLGLIGVGLVLIGNDSHSGVGRWLDGADMWVVQFVMDSRTAPPSVMAPPGALPAEATLRHCPSTYVDLEVQGCKR